MNQNHQINQNQTQIQVNNIVDIEFSIKDL